MYLNRSYAYIYNHIAKMHLTSPYQQQTYSLKSQQPNVKTIKYVALGDSLTAGVGSLDYQKTFPYLLAQNLAQKNNVDLINLAVPGAKTQDLIDSQINQAIKLQPDYITLLIGINDIHGLISAKKFETNFSEIINQLAEKTKAKIIVINLPYLGGKNLIFPPYDYYFKQKTEQFNKIIKTQAENKSVCQIDLFSQTNDLFSKNIQLYSTDFFHPSAKGYQLWANIIYANSNCFSN